MKANELRIGNLYWNVQDKEVCGVDPYDIVFLSEGGDPDCFQPIEINEEWVLKFGFDLRGNYWSKGNFIYQKAHNLWMWMGVYLPKIQYIHQLQNLYFAFTGQELEIKP